MPCIRLSVSSLLPKLPRRCQEFAFRACGPACSFLLSSQMPERPPV
ncbi:hypothetical protein GCWU000341_02546 [Oribacterium sp. oral taxon 078 str. F0262]|nr:hypothetical protein GCWU000341_02546 [Oribacterium sp. oral taxon 078 str. F0262]